MRLRVLILTILMSVTVTLAVAPTTGTTACPASGNTRVRTTSAKAYTFVIQAPSANAGSVCIGGPSVTTANSPCLVPGASISGLPSGNSAIYDLSTEYMACTSSGDSVVWSFQ